MIKLYSIVKSYQIGKEEVEILNNINIHIRREEFVAIMGPSGSGKSTLMNIIGCLDHPTSGTYLLNGEKILDYEESELAKVRNSSIGFVFQQFHLLPRLNARENVELPMIYAGISKHEREEKAVEALRKVKLADRVNHMPNELSGGQKQRVAIARAIVNQPRIILADEPTGALDPKTSKQIMELFTMLNQEGTTIVLVTHEPQVAEYASRIVLLKDGNIVQGEMEGLES